MNVGIIGAGLQGKRRSDAVKQLKDHQISIIADIDINRAKVMASEVHCQATDNWKDVTISRDVDAVVVCTPTYLHLPISLSAIENGKHVLCEKPLGRNPAEAEKIVKASHNSNIVLGVGLNHRFHPAVHKAHEMVKSGAIGELDFIRCRYGHGGRLGYEKEWRGSADKAGGGQMLDQGVHVLDLMRWFMGDFKEVTGFVTTRHWAISPLEDNAFALLRTGQGQVASLHVSWTQWKNLFSFEIFGREGYLVIDGLGGSYGTEKLIRGKRPQSLEPFQQEITEFTSGDVSWYQEWEDFVMSIKDRRQPLAVGNDGLQAVKLAYAVYESSKSGRTVQL